MSSDAPSARDAPLPPPDLPPALILNVPGRGEFFVRDSGGAGTPLLLLHGWMFGGDLNWHLSYRPLIDAGYRVIAVDHRGHGRGLRTPELFRLADCALDAARVVSTLGCGPVVAVGYSMGGPVAALLARDHRHLVRVRARAATAAGPRPRPSSRACPSPAPHGGAFPGHRLAESPMRASSARLVPMPPRPLIAALRPLLAAVLLLAATGALAACADTIQSRTVDANQVAKAAKTVSFPVYWLGRNFEGLPITTVDRDSSGAFDTAYGNCVEGGQDTCVTPLLVVTSPDNSFLPGRSHGRPSATIRGARVSLAQGGRTLEIATGSVVVDIYANSASLARQAGGAIAPLNRPGSPADPLPPPLRDTGYGNRPTGSDSVPNTIVPGGVGGTPGGVVGAPGGVGNAVGASQ